MLKPLAALAVVMLFSPPRVAPGAEWSVASPDGKAVLAVREAEGGGLTYTVSHSGEPVLAASPLGIVRDDAAFDRGLTLDSAGAVTPGEEAYTLVHGKRKAVRDRYNERVLSFKNADGQPVELHLRAFDDGVAFRYRFPGADATPRTVKAEATGFAPPEGSRVWVQPYDEPSVYTPGYESFWEDAIPAGTASPTRAGWAFPLLFRTPAGRWGLITEAGLDRNYCGSRLAAEAPGGVYRLRFPDPGEGNGTGDVSPRSALPWATPWRVVVVGATPAPIVETTVIESLNPPSVVADTSWIRPGRVSWSWLFDADSPQDFAKLKPFVDLAAEMGWEYTLVDANWDIMKNGTIHDLIAYAESKGVGVWLWYNSGGPHNVVTERPRGMMDQARVRRYEFERLAKWGVKGIKVDFFQSDKQDVIALYHDILRDAADFKIMINFHGCTLPRGWSRTYPHLMSMEAVRGAENYQFEPKFPAYAPRHNALMPFTRNAVGPMDYTPVMFRDNKHPLVVTAAHELALPVVFESGLLHFAGGPEEYRALPDGPKAFLKGIPVAWDETRFLAGEPGRFAVIARRSGETWYVGGINGTGEMQDVRFMGAALGGGAWTVTLHEDGARRPELATRTGEIEAGGGIRIPIPPRGGFALTLSPKR
jgi:hypothetical protein